MLIYAYVRLSLKWRRKNLLFSGIYASYIHTHIYMYVYPARVSEWVSGRNEWVFLFSSHIHPFDKAHWSFWNIFHGAGSGKWQELALKSPHYHHHHHHHHRRRRRLRDRRHVQGQQVSFHSFIHSNVDTLTHNTFTKLFLTEVEHTNAYYIQCGMLNTYWHSPVHGKGEWTAERVNRAIELITTLNTQTDPQFQDFKLCFRGLDDLQKKTFFRESLIMPSRRPHSSVRIVMIIFLPLCVCSRRRAKKLTCAKWQGKQMQNVLFSLG